MSGERVHEHLLKPWVRALTLQMQGTLIVATRGPDGLPKEDVSKELVRAFRATILNNAKKWSPENTFQRDGSGVTDKETVKKFLKSTDHLNYHWLMHFKHATEVVGYFHPNPDVRAFWNDFYLKLCDDAHHPPETKEQMVERLKNDGPTDMQAQVYKRRDDGAVSPCPICGYRMFYTYTGTQSEAYHRCENCSKETWSKL